MGEAAGGEGPEASVSVTPDGGPKVGVSVDKDGVKTFMQPKVAPFVYGPKTEVDKNGVHVKQGVTVETPSYPPDSPVGGFATGTASPTSAQVGGGVSAEIPKVGDVSADATVPVPANPMAPMQAWAYDYNNTPMSQRNPLVLWQADQIDGGHRLQDYNDNQYGPAAPGKKHVTICPYCPPWPNVPKDSRGNPKPLQGWEVHNGPEGD